METMLTPNTRLRLQDIIGSGTPDAGGAVTGAATKSLAWGTLYVDGVSQGTEWGAGALFRYDDAWHHYVLVPAAPKHDVVICLLCFCWGGAAWGCCFCWFSNT